jgi:hypothetical protein
VAGQLIPGIGKYNEGTMINLQPADEANKTLCVGSRVVGCGLVLCEQKTDGLSENGLKTLFLSKPKIPKVVFSWHLSLLKSLRRNKQWYHQPYRPFLFLQVQF